MRYCEQCGKPLDEQAAFCAHCGFALRQTEAANQAVSNDPAPADPGGGGQTFAAKLENINRTKDYSQAYHPQDIQQNKSMALLSYLSLLVLIPIFSAKESPFAKFHANQGLVLLLAEIAFGFAYSILSALLLAISWRLWSILSLLSLLWIFFGVLSVLGIINALNGKAKELPLIGHFKILK